MQKFKVIPSAILKKCKNKLEHHRKYSKIKKVKYKTYIIKKFIFMMRDLYIKLFTY